VRGTGNGESGISFPSLRDFGFQEGNGNGKSVAGTGKQGIWNRMQETGKNISAKDKEGKTTKEKNRDQQGNREELLGTGKGRRPKAFPVPLSIMSIAKSINGRHENFVDAVTK
jgi:hypothetical protein